jgi:hypothetical protein
MSGGKLSMTKPKPGSMGVMAILRQQVAPIRRGESLDDIAKDHVTHTDRRADGSGQNKVDTDDHQHGCSLGNEIPLHVWNTHGCNNCTVTFGTSLVQLPLGQAQNGEMTPLIVYQCRLQSQFRARGKAGSGQ